MKHLSLLIGVVLLVSSVTPVEALRYPPGLGGGGYVAVNLLGPTEVESGDTFTYTLILTNDSSTFARNVQVTYDMPDGVRWLDRFGHHACEQNINKIICTVELMQPGSQSIPLRFTTDRLIYTNSAFCPRTITSSARVSTGSYDAFAGDNTSPTLSTRITCYDPPTRSYRRGVDLQLNLTAPRSITVGEPLTLTVVVTNAGTENAMFVTMLLQLPSGLSINDIPRFCQITGTMITCTNFTLRSGESRSLTFTTPIHSSLTCPSSLEWRAQVYSGAQSSYSVYRTGSARTSVSCRPAPLPPSPPVVHPPSTQSGGGSSGGSFSGGYQTSDGSMGGSIAGGTSGNQTGSSGQHNYSYHDPLHVCDLPLNVIYPCPSGTGGSSGGGSIGGSSGGSNGGTTSGSFGGSSRGNAGGSGGEPSGTTGGGGYLAGTSGGSTSGGGFLGGGTPLRPVTTTQKKNINQFSISIDKGYEGQAGGPTPSPILPPDGSGNWVWAPLRQGYAGQDGQGWVYSALPSADPMINTDHWTLQPCTGYERGTITYEINISNPNERSIKDSNVVEMLNPTAVCIKNAAGGLIGPRHILWQIPPLAPFTTQTIRYTVGILSHVSDQFVIANLTHAGTSGPHILTRDFEMVEVERQPQ